MSKHSKTVNRGFGIRFAGLAVVFLAATPDADAQGFGRGGARVAVGPRGGAATVHFGGAAVGPFGGVHAGGIRTRTYVGPRGTTVQAGRVGAVGVGPYRGIHEAGAAGVRVTTPAGRVYSEAAFGARRGPYVGPTVLGGPVYHPGGFPVGHATRYWNPAFLESRAGFVRTNFFRPVFTPVWFRSHPGAWYTTHWRTPNWWLAPGWAPLAIYCGITDPPIDYDYGGTTVIENNTVYLNGVEIASADQYAVQAAALAEAGRSVVPAPTDIWQPLGVFGLIQGTEQEAQHVFQLAVDRSGIIRGNYYDTIVDNSVPVYGSVDPRTQRAVWSAGDKKTVVFETGLSNLTLNQTTVLVHYGTERTVQMGLVRLGEPVAGN